MMSELALAAVALLAVRLASSKSTGDDTSALPSPVTEPPRVTPAAPVARSLVGGGTVAPRLALGDSTGRFESSRAMTPAQYAENVAFVNANARTAIGFIPGIGVLNTGVRGYQMTRGFFDWLGDTFGGPAPTEQSRTPNIDAMVMEQSASVYGTGQAPVLSSSIDNVSLVDSGTVFGGGYSPLMDSGGMDIGQDAGLFGGVNTGGADAWAGQDPGLFGGGVGGSGGGSDGGFSGGGESPAFGPQ